MGLTAQYAEFDAETRFGLSAYTAEEDAECISGLIMQGVRKPEECSAYRMRCTPDHPLGAPMVSSEATARPTTATGACGRTSMSLPEDLTVAEVRDLRVQCPLPLNDDDHVQLAHGGGGRRMHELLEGLLLPAFGNDILLQRHDGATFSIAGAKLAFTTDSYVVRPPFFPGGDIETLAINGTVNDLAMCGARPLYLSSAVILEEGLPMETLRRVVESMRASAEAAGVQLVTGDTKVVDKGKGDEIFINTAGIGVVEHVLTISPGSVKAGDAILLPGMLADGELPSWPPARGCRSKPPLSQIALRCGSRSKLCWLAELRFIVCET